MIPTTHASSRATTISRRRLWTLAAVFAAATVAALAWASGIVQVTAEDVAFESAGDTLRGVVVRPRLAKPPFPAVVVVHGSGRATRASVRGFASFLAPSGFAVLLYDKRGAGASDGVYRSITVAASGELLRGQADDVWGAVRYLAGRRDIDSSRIALIGGSQAGWIMPLVASRVQQVRTFVAISGPTTDVGEVMAYFARRTTPAKDLARDDVVRRQQDMHRVAAGPAGHDPRPVLADLAIPSLWLFGGRDQNVPPDRSIAVLESLAVQRPPLFAWRLYPEGDHSLRAADGERLDYRPVVLDWLREHLAIDR